MTPRIEVHPDGDALATAVAGELLTRLFDLQAAGGIPQVCLTGGTVADRVHREVARMATAHDVDWAQVVFWWGDERFVAPDSPDRNDTAARAHLLDVVGATQVHPMPSTAQCASAEDAADDYGRLVREHGSVTFDVLMLGMGPDGHVASLFPGYDELDVDDRVAVAVHDSPKPPPDRISLTFAALNRSTAVWFLVSGEPKADAVAAALADEGSITATPARGVVGTTETLWWLDTDAASHL